MPVNDGIFLCIYLYISIIRSLLYRILVRYIIIVG